MEESMTKRGLDFAYDDDADVLYITDPTIESKEMIGNLDDDGVIVNHDPMSNKIAGITILDFMKRMKTGSLSTRIKAVLQG